MYIGVGEAWADVCIRMSMPFVRVDTAEKRYKRATNKNNKIKNGWIRMYISAPIVGRNRAVNFSGWLCWSFILMLALLLSFFSLMGFSGNEFTGLNGENVSQRNMLVST